MKYKTQTTSRWTDAKIMGFVLGKITNMVGGYTTKKKPKKTISPFINIYQKKKPSHECPYCEEGIKPKLYKGREDD